MGVRESENADDSEKLIVYGRGDVVELIVGTIMVEEVRNSP